MLPVDPRAIQEVAEQRGIEPAQVVRELEASLVAAANAHFGPQHVFECSFEDDVLTVRVAIRIKARPSAPGEVELAKAQALGFEVIEDDELLFEVTINNENGAHSNDREYGSLYGFKTYKSGFSAVAKKAMQKILPLENPPLDPPR